MNFPFYIARRYLISRSKNNAINIITGISSLGIIAGAMAMFVVLSVFSGLKEFSLSFINDYDPDLKVISKSGKSFTVDKNQIEKLSKIDGIQFYSSVVEERALFTFNEKDHLAYIKGVDSNYVNVSDVQKTIFQGEWFEEDTHQVLIGSGVAHKLSVGLFDFNNVFEAFVARPGKGVVNNPEEAFNRIVLIPVGYYFLNEELSHKYVFCDIDVARDLLEFKPNQVSAIELKLNKGASEKKVGKAVSEIFRNEVEVKNRTQLNESLHRMLNTENLVLYLILTLVLIVTLFTLIGAVIMIILDKKPNLKTLYNLGVEIKDLRKIFRLQGFMICIGGGIIGLILGLILVLIQKEKGLFMITSTMPHPVSLRPENVLVVLFTIGILGYLASWIASNRVNRKMLEN